MQWDRQLNDERRSFALTAAVRDDRASMQFDEVLHERETETETLAERGQFNEGSVQGQEGLRIAPTVDNPFSLTMAYRGLGSLYCVQGDFDNAVPLLERGLALARDSNMTLLAPTVMGWLGYAYALSGRGPKASLCYMKRWRASSRWVSEPFTHFGACSCAKHICLPTGSRTRSHSPSEL